MRNAALIDSGPIVALFNASDTWHRPCVDGLKNYSGQLVTTWPVIAEAAHLLSFAIAAQTAVLDWVERGGLRVEHLLVEDVAYIKARMKKYSDLPMDLADASLMCIAERLEINGIMTIDRDFSIYRTLKGKQLTGVLKTGKRR